MRSDCDQNNENRSHIGYFLRLVAFHGIVSKVRTPPVLLPSSVVSSASSFISQKRSAAELGWRARGLSIQSLFVALDATAVAGMAAVLAPPLYPFYPLKEVHLTPTSIFLH